METQQTTTNEELVLSVVAYLRRRELGESSKQAAEQNARRGVYTGKPVNGYVRLSGYDVHRIDESKRGKIARVWHLAGVENWPLRKLLSECEAVRLTSGSGGAMSLNSLHLMLTNPYYAGRIRTADGVVDGKHEALVSWTMFETVQRNLRKRKC